MDGIRQKIAELGRQRPERELEQRQRQAQRELEQCRELQRQHPRS